MLKVFSEIPPDTWHVRQILPLAIAFCEARENSGDFCVSLRSERCINKTEFSFIEIGLCACDVCARHARDVVRQKFSFEFIGHIEPGIL